MIEFPRHYKFRPWLYSVSHSSLLIRAENCDEGQNVDLMFFGVDYWQMTSRYIDVSIQSPTDDEMIFLRSTIEGGEKISERMVTVLQANGSKRYFIVASFFEIERNTHSPQETSLFS